jgi:hypothetical protein
MGEEIRIILRRGGLFPPCKKSRRAGERALRYPLARLAYGALSITH